MPMTHRKRAGVLGSAFIAAAVVLAPVGFEQAAAAAPSATHVGATVKAPHSKKDYQRGFRDGFKAGWRQARRHCDWNDQWNWNDHRQAPGFHHGKKYSNWDYQRGFKDGFKAGWRQGQRHC
ncbi:hypothetical protein ACF1A5_31045 [Streptomyces sp. NPDC014864]|uniref:hypothetical protein n=1 Tax=Streptomyces sp. NPDC014864 TaxID=3364924 RepID=UPI0036FC57CD